MRLAVFNSSKTAAQHSVFLLYIVESDKQFNNTEKALLRFHCNNSYVEAPQYVLFFPTENRDLRSKRKSA
jgi:hypothetical protein